MPMLVWDPSSHPRKRESPGVWGRRRSPALISCCSGWGRRRWSRLWWRQHTPRTTSDTWLTMCPGRETDVSDDQTMFDVAPVLYRDQCQLQCGQYPRHWSCSRLHSTKPNLDKLLCCLPLTGPFKRKSSSTRMSKLVTETIFCCWIVMNFHYQHRKMFRLTRLEVHSVDKMKYK